MSLPLSTRALTPEMRALQRRQLDGWLSALPALDPPRAGWIRTIRDALGMSLAQLGRRLGVSPQSVLSLEQRELEETISVGKLHEAAHAMGCALRIVFIPRTSLEETVREQATRRAHAERQRLVHTMRLEAQEDGLDAVLDGQRAIDAWMTTRARRLWD